MLDKDTIERLQSIFDTYAEYLEKGAVTDFYAKLAKEGTPEEADEVASFFINEAKIDLVLVTKVFDVNTRPIIKISAEHNNGKVTLPPDCTVKANAFNQVPIVSLVIPGSATLESDAIAGANELSSVLIEDGIRSIPGRCFAGCTSLTDVILPNTLREIGKYAFAECTSLSEITLPERGGILIQKGAFGSDADMPNIIYNGDPAKIRYLSSEAAVYDKIFKKDGQQGVGDANGSSDATRGDGQSADLNGEDKSPDTKPKGEVE